MSSLFKNEYKVYLYKYNYKKLQQIVSDRFSSQGNSGDAYKYLFESFITDLYSIGVPSEEIKKKYNAYIAEYKSINNFSTKSKTTRTGNNITATYTPSDASLVDKDTNVFAYRSPKTSDEDIVQDALAQNYALQKIQKDYEDAKMGDNSKINWLNAKESKETYENGIHNALDKSKELLDAIFNPIIDEITSIQNSGNIKSDFVYCIDLTDLSKTQVIENPVTDRTKNSCDNFLNPKISNRLISDDIETNALINIGAIKTDLTQLTNATSFTLRQDILLKYGIHIEPNDIIEITATNYNKVVDKNSNADNKDPLNRNTQFLGFVTQLESSSKYGQTTDITVTCEGISKLLALNPVVSDNAVMPQFNNLIDFISDKNDKTNPTPNINVYIHFYSGKTVYELFSDIMSNVLASSPIQGDEKNYTVRYVSDNTKLKKLQYQYCKSLIVLYHMAATMSTVRQCGKTSVIIAKVDCNILQTKLEAYLAQLRTNFTNFWSTYSSPLQILNAIVENSFLEIYEDRCGILIMRTPRYNTWFGNDIIPMEDIVYWNQTINDSILKSRSDYQWQIDYLGTMSNFPGNSYENIPALLKYGFRADSPKTSPNAKNEKLCAIFASLDVTRENGKTRTLTVTVPMIKDYKLGKLYYIPVQNLNGIDNLNSTGCVGYLSSIISTVNPGNVDEHKLEFRYVRSAELLEEDISVKENYGRILNFNHLPDLEILMNMFTLNDIEEPKDTSQSKKNTKVSSLPAQYHYYWAAYKGPYKKIFDNYASGGSANILSDEEKSYFDMSMAPTVLTKSSFQSYKDGENTISNTSYIPTQQLINDIWYIDMCLRYNENIGNDIVSYAKHDLYTAKILRSINLNKDSKSKFIDYLNRDATFTDSKSLPELISNSIGNYYANVGSYFINASLTPSMVQPINQVGDDTQLDRLNNFMTDFIKAYNTVIMYNTNQKIEFINTYCKDRINDSDENKINNFDDTFKQINKVIDEYNEFKNNDYNFVNLYSELYKNLNDTSTNLKYVRGMFTDYDNKNAGIWKTAYRQILFYKQANDFKNFNFKMLNNYLTFNGSYTSKDSKKRSVQHLIPAVILNEKPFPPLRIFNDFEYGAFLAGVSPVDYKPFFKNKITPVIKESFGKEITLQDNKFRNAKNEVIGTITDFVFDPSLSDNMNLYYYPVIEFNSKVSSEEKAKYITSKSDLTSFVNGSVTSKKLASIMVVAPTQIPESKIPTIQQIALNKGLYVGKIIDGSVSSIGDNLNTKAAIFNPSVLYKWSRDELNTAYTATIYNLMYNINTNGLKDFKSKNDLSDWSGTIDFSTLLTGYLDRVPCVFNTHLNFNKLNKTSFTDNTINDKIENIFNQISSVNEHNSFFRIEKFKGTPYYQLQDEVESLQDEHTTNTDQSIILNFTNDEGNLDQIVEKYKAPDNVLKASVGGTDKTLSDSFSEYVRLREDVNTGLYTENRQYSTIFYSDMDKYPTKVRRNSGKLSDETQ